MVVYDVLLCQRSVNIGRFCAIDIHPSGCQQRSSLCWSASEDICNRKYHLQADFTFGPNVNTRVKRSPSTSSRLFLIRRGSSLNAAATWSVLIEWRSVPKTTFVAIRANSSPFSDREIRKYHKKCNYSPPCMRAVISSASRR